MILSLYLSYNIIMDSDIHQYNYIKKSNKSLTPTGVASQTPEKHCRTADEQQ